MPSDRPSLPPIIGLSARAILAQLLLGAPFGLADFAPVLERTGTPAIAWAVAYAFGCYRAIGLPILLGGALIALAAPESPFGTALRPVKGLVGATERSGRLWAVAIAGLPTALIAGSYLPEILGSAKGSFPPGRVLGGILALWLLGTMVGMVGYGLGRIFGRFRKRKQVEP